MSRVLAEDLARAGVPRRWAGIDRALPVWASVLLALVFLMALPIGWLVWMSVGGAAGVTPRHYLAVLEDPALMKALWTRDGVTHRGEHFQVENARVEPKPVQQPHPPVLIGGWGDVTLRRAGQLGDGWLPGPTADLPRLLASRVKVAAAREATGRPPFTEWPVSRELVLADTDRAASFARWSRATLAALATVSGSTEMSLGRGASTRSRAITRSPPPPPRAAAAAASAAERRPSSERSAVWA